MKSIICGLFILCFSLRLSANTSTFHTVPEDSSINQTDFSDYIQIEAMRGFLAAHTQGMQELYQHTLGVQVHYQRSMLRNQYHPNQFKRVFQYGTTLNYQYLGSEAAGYAVGLGFSLFFTPGLSQHTRLTVGMGGGYLSKPYSLENPKNIAIGSHINGMMRLGIQRDIWVVKANNRRASAQLNVGMTHFSNGNWSQPNLGVNMPYVSMSYKYKLDLGAKQLKRMQSHQNALKQLNSAFEANRNITLSNRTWGLVGGFRVGRRQMEIDQEANFTTGIVELLVERSYSYEEFTNNKNLRSFSAHPHWGLTMFMDRSYQYNKPNPLPAYNFINTTELAAIVGNRYVFGRVGVLTDIGVYLYRPSDSKRRYFQALGLSYFVNQHLILTARLKVHLSSADYIEWGVGYRF
ncbi:MAG: acyloxyacyl hydrolase [Bacteroidota bacterium]|jgi:hypothetical protein